MSVWNQDRLGGYAGKRHMLGLWDPRHKLASSAYLPGTAQRRQLRGKTPFWYALSFTVPLIAGGGQTAYDRFTVTSDFWMTTLINNDTGFGGFPPLYDFTFTLFEVQTKRRYMSLPVNVENFSGGSFNSAETNIPGLTNHSFPFFFRKIVKIPAGSQMQARVQTPGPISGGTFTLQMVLGGYGD